MNIEKNISILTENLEKLKKTIIEFQCRHKRIGAKLKDDFSDEDLKLLKDLDIEIKFRKI